MKLIKYDALCMHLYLLTKTMKYRVKQVNVRLRLQDQEKLWDSLLNNFLNDYLKSLLDQLENSTSQSFWQSLDFSFFHFKTRKIKIDLVSVKL